MSPVALTVTITLSEEQLAKLADAIEESLSRRFDWDVVTAPLRQYWHPTVAEVAVEAAETAIDALASQTVQAP